MSLFHAASTCCPSTSRDHLQLLTEFISFHFEYLQSDLFISYLFLCLSQHSVVSLLFWETSLSIWFIDGHERKKHHRSHVYREINFNYDGASLELFRWLYETLATLRNEKLCKKLLWIIWDFFFGVAKTLVLFFVFFVISFLFKEIKAKRRKKSHNDRL